MPEIICPKGVSFTEVEEMCKHYGILYESYKYYLHNNWTTPQALGIDPPPQVLTCPRGIKFKKVSEMCKHYGISYPTYMNRIARNWTVSQALGIDLSPLKRVCPNGFIFNNNEKMYRYYEVTGTTYTGRISRGWTERQALGIDPPPKRTKKAVNTYTQLWNERLTVLQKEKNLGGNQFYLTQDKETMKNYVLTEEQIKTYPQCLQVFKKL